MICLRLKLRIVKTLKLRKNGSDGNEEIEGQ